MSCLLMNNNLKNILEERCGKTLTFLTSLKQHKIMNKVTYDVSLSEVIKNKTNNLFTHILTLLQNMNSFLFIFFVSN